MSKNSKSKNSKSEKDGWRGTGSKEFTPYLSPRPDEVTDSVTWWLHSSPRSVPAYSFTSKKDASLALDEAVKAWDLEKMRPFTYKEFHHLLKVAGGNDPVNLKCGAYASRTKPIFLPAGFVLSSHFSNLLDSGLFQDPAAQPLLRMIEWKGKPSAFAMALDEEEYAGVYYWWGELPVCLWTSTGDNASGAHHNPLEAAPQLFRDYGDAKYKLKISDGRSCFAYKGENGYLVLTLCND